VTWRAVRKRLLVANEFSVTEKNYVQILGLVVNVRRVACACDCICPPCRELTVVSCVCVCVCVCRVVSCRVVSCRVVSCRVVSCRVVSCRVVSRVMCRVVCRVQIFLKPLSQQKGLLDPKHSSAIFSGTDANQRRGELVFGEGVLPLT
jgi:hypothetical protein